MIDPSPTHPASTMPAREAILLGVIQGPTELLPVSSSAHLRLIPFLLDWDHDQIDSELRKAFEVAVHAGAAAALLITQRELIADELRDLDARRAAVIILSFLPPAVAGLAMERPIEQRLGNPAGMAAGLAGGALAMLAADRTPQWRGRGEAGAGDGLRLGLAQAAALAPGVSRNGATLIAARRRGFTREQSNLLSRTVALPVISGAALLKGERLRRRGLEPGMSRAIGLGVVASFFSTVLFRGLIGLVERDRALWPYAAYRLGLAALVAEKLRRLRRRPGQAVESEV